MIHGFDTHFKDLLEHPSAPQRDLSSLRTGILAAGMRSTEPIARRAQDAAADRHRLRHDRDRRRRHLSFLDSDEERTTMSGWPLPGYEIKIVDPESGATQPPGVLGRDLRARLPGDAGLLQKARGDGAGRSTPTAGCTPATSACCAPTAACASSAATRTCSRSAARTSIPMEVEGFLLDDPRDQPRRRRRPPGRASGRGAGRLRHPEAGAELSEQDVIDACRGRIASFKIPRHVFFVDAFPMTGSGQDPEVSLARGGQGTLPGGVTRGILPLISNHT